MIIGDFSLETVISHVASGKTLTVLLTFWAIMFPKQALSHVLKRLREDLDHLSLSP